MFPRQSNYEIAPSPTFEIVFRCLNIPSSFVFCLGCSESVLFSYRDENLLFGYSFSFSFSFQTVRFYEIDDGGGHSQGQVQPSCSHSCMSVSCRCYTRSGLDILPKSTLMFFFFGSPADTSSVYLFRTDLTTLKSNQSRLVRVP